MLRSRVVSMVAVVGLVMATLPAVHEARGADPAASLSPKLQEALREEMRLITDGMGRLVESISLGDWEAVATTASQVQHSFILKQKLTADEAEELHAKLPAGFLRLDRRFHGTAGKLAQAAHDGNAELATHYYFRLLDGCVSCHGQYAPKRFPGLADHAPMHDGDDADDGHGPHVDHRANPYPE